MGNRQLLWGPTLAVIVALLLGLSAQPASANSCYGNDIGNGDCCGRDGNRIYWCPNGEQCDGLTRCKTGDSDDTNSHIGGTATGVVALGVLLCICYGCYRCRNQRRNATVSAAERTPINNSRGPEAVVVVAAAVPESPTSAYTAVQPGQQQQPQQQPAQNEACPYAPAANVYGYDHERESQVRLKHAA